jgi:WD40 repeat protein
MCSGISPFLSCFDGPFGRLTAATVLLALVTAGLAALEGHTDLVAPAETGPVPGTDLFGDPLPAGARARMGTVRFRHQSAVMRVGFAPDGKMLASAGLDQTLRLWNTATGKELRRISCGVDESEFPWFGGTLAFAPDGKSLVLAGHGIGFWDAATGAAINRLPTTKDADTACLAAQFCADGRILVALREKETLRLVDARAGKELFQSRDLGRPSLVALSPDGTRLAVTSRNNQGAEFFRLLDTTSDKEMLVPDGLHGQVQSAVFAAHGKTLALCDLEHLRILDGETGKQLRAWKVDGFGSLAFSPDDQALAAGSNKEIHLWDPATGKLIRTFTCFQWVESVAFSKDGKMLVAGTGSTFHRYHPVDDQCGGVVHLFDVATGKRVGPQDAHQDAALCVTWAQGGKLLISGSRDGTVRTWDAATAKQLRVLAGHEDDVLALALSADGKLLASASRDKTVRLWDLASGKELARLPHGGPVYSVALAPGGKTLASADTRAAHLWDIGTAKEVRHWDRPEHSGVYAVAFAPDGKTLAWAGGQHVYLPDSGDNAIRLVDAASGKEIGLLPGHKGSMAVCGLAFSADSQTLAAGYMNASLRLWSPAKKELLHEITVGANSAVAFAADGRSLVATSGQGSTLTVFETATGKERLHIDSPQGGVHGAAIAPDGRSLASAGNDATVLVWDLTKPGRSASRQLTGGRAVQASFFAEPARSGDGL